MGDVVAPLVAVLLLLSPLAVVLLMMAVVALHG